MTAAASKLIVASLVVATCHGVTATNNPLVATAFVPSLLSSSSSLRDRLPSRLFVATTPSDSTSSDISQLYGPSSTSSSASSTSTRTQSNSNQRTQLLETAIRLRQKHGIFISPLAAKEELQRAVIALEGTEEAAAADRSTAVSTLLGDWTLICTTNTPTTPSSSSSSFSSSSRPSLFSFFQKKSNDKKKAKTTKKPTSSFLSSLWLETNVFQVSQRVRSMEEDAELDRVDNVLTFRQPSIWNQTLSTWAPLWQQQQGVLPTTTKVSLIHKASIESVRPLFRTRIGLQSIVVTVGGMTQSLPAFFGNNNNDEWSDILGINLPLGEFLNVGSFDTTYLEDNLRISRSEFLPGAAIIRVFVRTGSQLEQGIMNRLEQDEEEEGEADVFFDM